MPLTSKLTGCEPARPPSGALRRVSCLDPSAGMVDLSDQIAMVGNSVMDRPSSADDTKTASLGPEPVHSHLALLVSGPAGVGVFPLPRQASVTIGRTDDADIAVADASVSRLHARLVLRGQLVVEDLGSTNGTRVLGRRLRVREAVSVSVGTVIEIGATTLIVQRASAELPATSDLRLPAPPPPTASPTDDGPVVASPTMLRLYALLDVLAPSPLTVLVLGETGVGKEVFAEAIHRRSARADRQFLQLNCAALPESVLEGELFGYEKGAFTGAATARAGLFEAVSGGTVFLDEIGELPLGTQAKLLRVLENGEVLRLGSRKPLRVDVRFVAATNRDPRAMIAEGTFRADLFFRLNGMTITVPPLRARPEEIAPLARRFLDAAGARLGRPGLAVDPAALATLTAYAWPGNVRELRNVLERAATFCRDASLTREALASAAPELVDADADPSISDRVTIDPPSLASFPRSSGRPPSLASTVEAVERDRILEALALTNGNQTRAAQHLGISRRSLIHRLDAYGVGRPRKPPPSG